MNKKASDTIIYGVTDRSKAGLFTRVDDWLIDHSRVTTKEKGQLFHALQLLVGSGVTFTRAMEILSEKQKNERLRRILATIHHDMTRRGMSFSKAIAKYPRVFSSAESKMLYSAELTGKMEQTLSIVSEQIERSMELRSRIRSAMTYPIIVLCVVVLAVVVMMIKVVPQFSNLFESMGTELPFATRMIIGMSNGFIQYWALMLIIIGATWGLFQHWKSTQSGQRKWGNMLLNMPIFKGLIQNINTTRVALNLSTLLKSDVAVPEALQIVGDIMPNRVVGDALRNIRKNILDGYRLHDSFAHEKALDPILSEVIEIGEQGGRIPEVLHKVGTQYERETQDQLKNLSTMIEPIMLVFVAVVVAFMALGILTPILKFQEMATGGM